MSFISDDELTLTIKEIREKLESIVFGDENNGHAVTCDHCDEDWIIDCDVLDNFDIDEIIEEMIVDAQKKTCCKED